MTIPYSRSLSCLLTTLLLTTALGSIVSSPIDIHRRSDRPTSGPVAVLSPKRNARVRFAKEALMLSKIAINFDLNDGLAAHVRPLKEKLVNGVLLQPREQPADPEKHKFLIVFNPSAILEGPQRCIMITRGAPEGSIPILVKLKNTREYKRWIAKGMVIEGRKIKSDWPVLAAIRVKSLQLFENKILQPKEQPLNPDDHTFLVPLEGPTWTEYIPCIIISRQADKRNTIPISTVSLGLHELSYEFAVASGLWLTKADIDKYWPITSNLKMSSQQTSGVVAKMWEYVAVLPGEGESSYPPMDWIWGLKPRDTVHHARILAYRHQDRPLLFYCLIITPAKESDTVGIFFQPKDFGLEWKGKYERSRVEYNWFDRKELMKTWRRKSSLKVTIDQYIKINDIVIAAGTEEC